MSEILFHAEENASKSENQYKITVILQSFFRGAINVNVEKLTGSQ